MNTMSQEDVQVIEPVSQFYIPNMCKDYYQHFWQLYSTQFLNDLAKKKNHPESYDEITHQYIQQHKSQQEKGQCILTKQQEQQKIPHSQQIINQQSKIPQQKDQNINEQKQQLSYNIENTQNIELSTQIVKPQQINGQTNEQNSQSKVSKEQSKESKEQLNLQSYHDFNQNIKVEKSQNQKQIILNLQELKLNKQKQEQKQQNFPINIQVPLKSQELTIIKNEKEQQIIPKSAQVIIQKQLREESDWVDGLPWDSKQYYGEQIEQKIQIVKSKSHNLSSLSLNNTQGASVTKKQRIINKPHPNVFKNKSNSIKDSIKLSSSKYKHQSQQNNFQKKINWAIDDFIQFIDDEDGDICPKCTKITSQISKLKIINHQIESQKKEILLKYSFLQTQKELILEKYNKLVSKNKKSVQRYENKISELQSQSKHLHIRILQQRCSELIKRHPTIKRKYTSTVSNIIKQTQRSLFSSANCQEQEPEKSNDQSEKNSSD